MMTAALPDLTQEKQQAMIEDLRLRGYEALSILTRPDVD